MNILQLNAKLLPELHSSHGPQKDVGFFGSRGSAGPIVSLS